MSTPKEIFLELLKPDGKPERMLCQYEPIFLNFIDPVNFYLNANRRRGSVSKDRWGCTITFPEDAPGAMPLHGEGITVCPDITHWRDTVHAPDLEANCMNGWEEARSTARALCGEDHILASFMSTGIFEQCHNLMGFEDTLTNLYVHPKEMHELIEYILNYRMLWVKLLIENLKPDAIFCHDDWGTKDSLFMKPEMWREFFKEPYRRFYSYIRSQGVIAIHHADSYLVPIVEDMAEIGIQVWQGVLPENNIPELQNKLQGRMVLMGGIGAAIDRADATEEEIRAYTEDVLRRCCPGGHFIPSITYGIGGTVFPHVDPILNDVITEYNSCLHLPRMNLPSEAAREKKTAVFAASEQAAAEEEGILSRISKALYRGQQKKLLTLCEEALAQGESAQNILNKGLLPGMERLGEDFTANRVFVPEMLLSARCMSSATERLKPYLAEAGSKSVGRVCLGTVKGDMHDIGKNLVKIMMEGSGLEVIDLGVDVSPETFVSTAIDRKCDIIACSSLLTTTMQEMRRVCILADEAGIRPGVKIMVGGAPITQSFCDEIGADAYTSDAAQAARVAAALLS